MTTMYVTRYGLTQGILKVDGRLSENGGMFTYRTQHTFFDQFAHGPGRDFHATLEDAQARVAEMASKRVAGCKKTIRKLEAYVPKVIEG
ncbi:hypothetical protein D3C77_48810 [compost metagenome]